MLNLTLSDKILDVGCGDGLSFEDFNKRNNIIGLDIHPNQKIFQNNFRYIQGDGSKLPFKKNEFDIVINIGVLEHIHPFKKLEKFAKEIQRVGKKYAIIVPHYYTFLEPHFQLPLWQFYPHKLKSFLIKHFNLGSQKRDKRGQYQKLNYLKKEEWGKLFPEAKIISYNHIWGGLIKNYIIYKN